MLEGQEGRIMVEMPGVKDPERMRKLLQGSANLEFWETYASQEIAPYLQQLDSRLANGEGAQTADTTKVAEAAAPADTVKTATLAKADSTKNQLPEAYQARQKQTAIVRDNYIYLFGGQDSRNTYSDVYKGRLNSIDWEK